MDHAPPSAAWFDVFFFAGCRVPFSAT